jgi:hypothetical protein
MNISFSFSGALKPSAILRAFCYKTGALDAQIEAGMFIYDAA